MQDVYKSKSLRFFLLQLKREAASILTETFLKKLVEIEQVR